MKGAPGVPKQMHRRKHTARRCNLCGRPITHGPNRFNHSLCLEAAAAECDLEIAAAFGEAYRPKAAMA